MKIGFIGLGKMGLNMVTRLIRGGHEVIAYDVSPEARASAKKAGAEIVQKPENIPASLTAPRVVWVMVPAGEITSRVINDIAGHLDSGDIIIDGGNSNFHDTTARSEGLKGKGLHLIDAGTSGGVWGLQIGYCLMVGGEKEAFDHVEPVMKTLAPENGYHYVGSSGAGHYVKMIHNGIEYAMMQAYAEGFEILEKSTYDLDLAAISNLWNNGSVIRSWLLELAGRAFENDPGLSRITGYVEDSGEGRWTVLEAIDRDVPALAITYSLMNRFRSRQKDSFTAKVLAALRNQFGGHAVKEKTDDEK